MARKEKTIHYLYKTTCLITNRYYIGIHSTSNLEDGYLGSGKRLRYSVRKYGEDNHNKMVLEYFPNRELLVEAEKKAITLDMINDNNCMNIMSGGTGGFISEEQQRYRSQCAGKALAKRLKNDTELYKLFAIVGANNFKKAHSDGKIKYDTFTGKQHTEETLKKMRDKKKGSGLGENNSQYGTCWVTKEGINKKIKKEEINKFNSEGWIKGRI